MPRPKNPAARKGLRYEREVGKGIRRLGATYSWPFHYQLGLRDERGNLHVPDFVLETRTRTILIETKLRFTLAGIDQLYRYAPLVFSLIGKPVVLCLVAMHLTPEAQGFPPIKRIDSLAEAPLEGPFVQHCLFPRHPNL